MTACEKKTERRGRRVLAIPARCHWRRCRKDFIATREDHYYCSTNCSKAAWAAGEAKTQRKLSDLGPAKPLIQPDTEGVWRRCLDAARSEVAESDMHERFPNDLVERAIAQARGEGFRQPLRGRGLKSSLSRLPAGIPVW